MKSFFLKLSLISCILSATILSPGAFAQKKKIQLLEIKDEIDAKMSRYVLLGLKNAKETNADYIVIELDTYGGTVSDADKIRTLLIEYPKPVFVFINDNAASAGSLISIACDSIYMSPGATLGASTVVDQDGKTVSDKFQSYMRSKMRSTAEATGRDPKIAEAFVGNMNSDSSNNPVKVLTLSTKQAMAVGYCEGEVNSIEEILNLNHIKDYSIVRFEMRAIEKIEAFFLNPYLRSILILLILAGLYFEMQHPGIGFALFVSIAAAVLYFVPSYLHGFAQNWEIVLFIIGIALLILEILVIPGFGIAGISGIILTFAGLFLVMLNNDFFDFSMVGAVELAEALTVMLIGTVGGVLFLIIAGNKFINSKTFKKITLQDELKTKEGYTSSFFSEPMIGKSGETYTVLRPSGKIMVEGKLYDAFSRSEFIEKGVEVIIIEESTTSLKVKRKEA